ncbi:ErfK/YbiS/YcfS/YnhG precursor [Candidatus Methylomirabilis oxygeniifera]|uniref:ErfK/YbiS/YcfS/YnhG n=1 Tax=Methylomirabilis oxygeniifera TaxID=671143 RepID=D5ML39_METO1|nr:ErfK/YbiS/YcfS/YnhG precursor [Candidatus Methylomirabilis oxyfera]
MSSRPLWRTFIVACFLLLSAPSDLWSATSPPPSRCTIQYPSDTRIDWECRRLRARETLETLFGNQWVDLARFNRIDRRHAIPGVSLKVPKRLEDVAGFTPMPQEYPLAAAEAKLILVDLAEQFLGAYEHGRLAFSVPIASGERENETPAGEFTITAAHRRHHSSRYTIEKTGIPYPMNYALRFHTSTDGIAFWMHGRDMPGYPASHGCIGLYDEPMQKKYYGYPRKPVLEDARTLYNWVLAPLPEDEKYRILDNGPRVLIVGHAPVRMRRSSRDHSRTQPAPRIAPDAIH